MVSLHTLKCFLRVLLRVHLVMCWPASLNLNYSCDPILISAISTKPNNKQNFQNDHEILSFFCCTFWQLWTAPSARKCFNLFQEYTLMSHICSSEQMQAWLYKNLMDSSSKKGLDPGGVRGGEERICWT